MENLPVTLLDLLSNSLVLRQIAPYLTVKSILDLEATSNAYRTLLRDSIDRSDAYRRIDLSQVRSAIADSTPIDKGGISWRAERMDESLTEDDFYCGPVRGILSKLNQRQIMQNVSTLILDGLSVPADLIREIITEPAYNVRILSIRECKHLNERILNQLLRYAVRPSRPQGTPKLRALYVFGPKDPSTKIKAKAAATQEAAQIAAPAGVTSSEGAQIGAEWNQKSSQALSTRLGQPQDRWYRPMGRVIKPMSEWPETLKACEGIIAFDAVLCRGPRHDPEAGKDYLKPTIATIALGSKGCESCGSCPEGPAVLDQAVESSLPLLAPPPLHSSTVKAAQRPVIGPFGPEGALGFPSLMLRCEDCLRGRWCERCNKWWCENCYQEPKPGEQSLGNLNQQDSGYAPPITAAAGSNEQQSTGSTSHDSGSSSVKEAGVIRHCWGCGRTCAHCKERFIRQCRDCRQEFCIVDDEGCSATSCAWCNHSGRRTRELY